MRPYTEKQLTRARSRGGSTAASNRRMRALDEPRDVYAEAMGSTGSTRDRLFLDERPAPPRRLEPCVALMGYDAARSRELLADLGW